MIGQTIGTALQLARAPRASKQLTSRQVWIISPQRPSIVQPFKFRVIYCLSVARVLCPLTMESFLQRWNLLFCYGERESYQRNLTSYRAKT